MSILRKPLLASAFVIGLAISSVTNTPPSPAYVAPLSPAELAATWGGVFGGKVGQNNKGILELSCGVEDLWPTGTPPLWENGSKTFVRECETLNRPHYLPRYATAEDAVAYVGGFVTTLYPAGSTPTLKLYVNGNPSPIFTVGCVPRVDYAAGIAFGTLPWNDREVRAFACPANADGTFGTEEVSLANVGLHPGLNAIRAATTGSFDNDENAQDQEIRFFCVGDGDCLPARIELRPVANGALNQFEFSSTTPRWQGVNDYPDPADPTNLGTCFTQPPVMTLIAHTSQTVKRELFVMGGAVPPGLTFSSCTIKSHVGGSTSVCGSHPTTNLVVRDSAGTESVGPPLNIHGADLLEYTRRMTTNPFTGTAWKSADLTGVQAGLKEDASGTPGTSFNDLIMVCEF